MADPEFSGGGNPKSRGTDLLVWPFFPENYMKVREDGFARPYGNVVIR